MRGLCSQLAVLRCALLHCPTSQLLDQVQPGFYNVLGAFRDTPVFCEQRRPPPFSRRPPHTFRRPAGGTPRRPWPRPPRHVAPCPPPRATAAGRGRRRGGRRADAAAALPRLLPAHPASPALPAAGGACPPRDAPRRPRGSWRPPAATAGPVRRLPPRVVDGSWGDGDGRWGRGEAGAVGGGAGCGAAKEYLTAEGISGAVLPPPHPEREGDGGDDGRGRPAAVGGGMGGL